MRIVMLNPPYYPFFSRASRSPAVTRSSTLYYPFFLAYATGVLEEEGHQVTLLDAPAAKWNHDTTIRSVSELKPDLVIVETSTPSIENDAEVAARIKQESGAVVVGVGTHVSALPAESLESYPGFDIVCRREYEYTLRELAAVDPRDLKSLNGVKGISYREGKQVIHNDDRKPIEDLDGLPFASAVYSRHLRPYIHSYFYGANLHPVIAILGGRGCPHQCAYCVYPQTMTGNRYRLRSVENLVDELAYIKSEFPEVNEIFLEDDTLTVNPKRARRIANEIIQRELNITWSTNSRADADFETMNLMRKSGCRLLCVGFESGDQQILDKIGKRIKLDNYKRFRDDARRAGLLIHGCFMFGNENDTQMSMENTVQLAMDLEPDTAQFYPIMVYPGTKAFERALADERLVSANYRDWLTPQGFHNCVVRLPGFEPEELVEFAETARRRFYLRPKYILSKMVQFIRFPRERKRLLRGGISLLSKMLRST